MGRGPRQERSQGAQGLLFGPRRPMTKRGRDKNLALIRQLREQYQEELLNDPHNFIARFAPDRPLIQAGPLSQAIDIKSWSLLPTEIGDRLGFNIQTTFVPKRGGGRPRNGSAGMTWTLEEAVDKMYEDCHRSKQVVVNQDMPIDHIAYDQVVDGLVDIAVEAELKKQGLSLRNL